MRGSLYGRQLDFDCLLVTTGAVAMPVTEGKPRGLKLDVRSAISSCPKAPGAVRYGPIWAAVSLTTVKSCPNWEGLEQPTTVGRSKQNGIKGLYLLQGPGSYMGITAQGATTIVCTHLGVEVVGSRKRHC
jgi:hypothetical protein